MKKITTILVLTLILVSSGIFAISEYKSEIDYDDNPIHSKVRGEGVCIDPSFKDEIKSETNILGVKE